MNLWTRPLLVAVATGSMLLATSRDAEATTLGIPSFVNYGSYAHWDSFSAKTFTNETPDAANTSLITATFNHTFPASPANAGALTGSGDRLYNGQGASSVAFNGLINGTVSGPVDSLILLLKLTPPDVATLLTRTTFFTVDLTTSLGNPTDLAPIEINSHTGEVIGSDPPLPMGVIRYLWTGLGLDASDTFSISVTSPASGHVSLDGLYLTTIPEPASASILALGCLLLMARRRNRSS